MTTRGDEHERCESDDIHKRREAFPFALFALGIVAISFLAVSVLAGTAAYAAGEAQGWPVGLARRSHPDAQDSIVVGAFCDTDASIV